MLRLNNSDEYEYLCTVKLSKEKFPIAFENKVQELMEEEGLSRADAEEATADMEVELELYYHKGYGLFAVDADAVGCSPIYSPYSGELCEDAIVNN